MNINQYLLDDNPLIVLPKLAVALQNVNKAIVLQQVHYWLGINQRDAKNKAETHFFDGRWWMYNTYAEWRTDNFPFWSERTIMRLFAALKGEGLIECREHENQQKGLWVTILYENLEEKLGIEVRQVVTPTPDKLSPLQAIQILT